MRAYRALAPLLTATVLAAGCSGGETIGGSGSPSEPVTAGVDNGVADLPAAQILARAEAALRTARTVRISGAITGNLPAKPAFALDMRIKGSDGGVGSVTLSGEQAEIIRIEQTGYVKASAKFWQQRDAAAAARRLTGRYLKASTGDAPLKELAGYTTVGWLAWDSHGPLTKGERKTINGVEVIAVVDSGPEGGTTWVALRGEPYPVRLTVAGVEGEDGGQFDFHDYGEPVELTAPPANVVVDAADLPGF